MRDAYLARYQDLSRRHWWWRARRRWLLEIVDARWGHQIGRILVIGCGPGHEIPSLADRGEVLAIEPEGELVTRQARERATVLETAFTPDLSLSGRFDLVVMADVLEHLFRPVPALRHLGDLLTPGGSMLLTVPAFSLLWTSHDELNQHQARYTKSSFRDVAACAGLKVEMLAYLFHWTFPAKLLQRGIEGLLGRSLGIPSVPPSPVNRFLYTATRLEQKIVTPLRPPFGTSLVAIGGRHS